MSRIATKDLREYRRRALAAIRTGLRAQQSGERALILADLIEANQTAVDAWEQSSQILLAFAPGSRMVH